jgi:hypothetical protein
VSRSAKEALLYADCSPVEKVVLQAIADHGRGMDGSGGFPSVRRFALIARVRPSTVHIALKTLAAKGWLSWSRASKNSASTYTIHHDAISTVNLNRVPISGTPAVDHVPISGTPNTDRVLISGTPNTDPCTDNQYVVYRSSVSGVPISGDEAKDEAKDDDDRSSSSFSLRLAQEFWNAHRGPMGESTIRRTPHLQKLFAARVKDGLTETVCQQAISKMAALPYFRGEIDDNLGDFVWLLGTHKETGEPNFRKVLRGDYDPRPEKKTKRAKPVTTIGLEYLRDAQ